MRSDQLVSLQRLMGVWKSRTVSTFDRTDTVRGLTKTPSVLHVLCRFVAEGRSGFIFRPVDKGVGAVKGHFSADCSSPNILNIVRV